jgi:AraC family transcriptional regulator
VNGAAAKAAYARRMHRMLEHIDQQVDQSLDLATLAAMANFSPFHFHRLFTAWMGETLGEYITGAGWRSRRCCG